MTQIVFIAPVKFDALWQRHQSLATELAKCKHKVVYINPVNSGGFDLHQKPVNDHLKVIQLKVPFKGVSFPALQKMVARWCMYLLKNRLNLTTNTSVLWIAEPALASLSNFCWLHIIYDRCDLHGEFPGQRKQAWKFYETMLFARSDLICISHPFLRPGIAEQHKVLLIKNAGTEEFSNHKLSAKEQSKVVHIVSSGAHFEWVDMDWLIKLAQCNPVKLHIAGTGRGEKFERLLQFPSVKYHPNLTKTELGNLLQSCHAGVVPFADLPLIEGVDPIKVYEYAQFGLHIWSPALRALADNPFINARLADKPQMQKAIARLVSTGFKAPDHPPVPLWSHRITYALDRLNDLSSN